MKDAYLKWVSSLPCANCGAQGYTQAAHYQGIRGNDLGRGLSIKADDLMVAPLCFPPDRKGCHSRFDDYEFSTFGDHWMRKIDSSELFLSWIAKTLVRAHKEGVIQI